MKSYKKSSFHKLYLIDVEKKEIIDLNEEHMDGVVEKFNSKRFLWSNAHDCIPCGGFRCGSFPCSGCKKVFTTKFSLKRHFKTFHTVPKCCKYCNARKLHTTPENTKTPQTSAKKYSCQACDKSYTRSCNLKIHIQKVHEGLKLPRSSAGIKNEFQITNSEKKFEFTPDEVHRLETFFCAKKHINTFEIENLAKHGNFPEEKVQEWFENRRLNTLGKSELLDRYIAM